MKELESYRAGYPIVLLWPLQERRKGGERRERGRGGKGRKGEGKGREFPGRDQGEKGHTSKPQRQWSSHPVFFL